MQKKRYLNF